MPATLNSLFQSARRLKRKQHIWMSDVGFGKEILTAITPFRGMKIIAFSFTVPGLTQYEVTRTGRKIGPIPHHEIIAFQDCNILDQEPEESERGNYFKIDYKGSTYWAEKIDVDRQKVTVRCDCRDYYFTGSYWNFRHGCQWGPPPKPYIRKTRTYPERNPLHTPFICKHIYYLWRNFFLRTAKGLYTK